MSNTKPTIEPTREDSKVIWQGCGEDNVPEPAILIDFYSETIGITQEGKTILLNYETVAAFCQLLKSHKP